MTSELLGSMMNSRLGCSKTCAFSLLHLGYARLLVQFAVFSTNNLCLALTFCTLLSAMLFCPLCNSLYVSFL